MTLIDRADAAMKRIRGVVARTVDADASRIQELEKELDKVRNEAAATVDCLEAMARELDEYASKAAGKAKKD